jgi:hypothetical protein
VVIVDRPSEYSCESAELRGERVELLSANNSLIEYGSNMTVLPSLTADIWGEQD